MLWRLAVGVQVFGGWVFGPVCLCVAFGWHVNVLVLGISGIGF
jgi:hypothetical protein